MKISTFKTEVLVFSRNPVYCSLKVGGVLLKQVGKFHVSWVAFKSDGRQEELTFELGKAKCCDASLVAKREVCNTANSKGSQNRAAAIQDRKISA